VQETAAEAVAEAVTGQPFRAAKLFTRPWAVAILGTLKAEVCKALPANPLWQADARFGQGTVVWATTGGGPASREVLW